MANSIHNRNLTHRFYAEKEQIDDYVDRYYTIVDERLSRYEKEPQTFFGCPCPEAWNKVSEYVLSIFFERPLTEEQHWEQFFKSLPEGDCLSFRVNIHTLCSEALQKYPEIEGRTTLELFFNSFETAVKKGDYQLAKRMLQYKPVIKVGRFADFTFVVNGNLNPAFKEIPELCHSLLAKRGFLNEELNPTSLSVALREMPSVVPALTPFVTPLSLHFDEAITLKREEAIALFLKKSVLPTSKGFKSAVQMRNFDLVDQLLSHGFKVTPEIAQAAVKSEDLQLINSICKQSYDLWPCMFTRAKHRKEVFDHLMGLPYTPGCFLFLLRRDPMLIFDKITNLNQALLEIRDDQVAKELFKKLKPDAASFSLAKERGLIETEGEYRQLSLSEKRNITKIEPCGCLIDQFPEFLGLIKEENEFIRRNIEYYCVEGYYDFSEIDIQSISQFLSHCFAEAISHQDFFFAQKLLESGVKFPINIPFVVNGALNPLFKKLPQIFEYRQLLQSDLNPLSLLVALREMPAVVPYILQNKVTPASEHLEEAMRLENNQAIALFRERNVCPSSAAVDAAIQKNDVSALYRLLKMGAKVPEFEYNLYNNPEYQQMVLLLKIKGAQFSVKFARQCVDNENRTLMAQMPPSFHPIMIAYAYNADKAAEVTFLLNIIFPNHPQNEKVESCCIRAMITYPKLETAGKTLNQYFADAFVTAVKSKDYSLAFQILKVDAQFNVSSLANFSLIVNGSVNPAFSAIMPELQRIALPPDCAKRETKSVACADIKLLSEERYQGLVQRVQDFPCDITSVKCFAMLRKRKNCSTEALYKEAHLHGMNAVCSYLEGISLTPKSKVVLKNNPSDELKNLNRYSIHHLDAIFKKHHCNIKWEDVAKELFKDDFNDLCRQEVQYLSQDAKNAFNREDEENRVQCSNLEDEIAQKRRANLELRADNSKLENELWVAEYVKRNLDKELEEKKEIEQRWDYIDHEKMREELEKENKEKLTSETKRLEGEVERLEKEVDELPFGVVGDDERKLISDLANKRRELDRNKARLEHYEDKEREKLERIKWQQEAKERKIEEKKEAEARCSRIKSELAKNKEEDIYALQDKANSYREKMNNPKFPIQFINVVWRSITIEKKWELINYLRAKNRSAVDEWETQLRDGEFESSSLGGITLKQITHLAFLRKYYEAGLFEKDLINYDHLGHKSFEKYLFHLWQSEGAELSLDDFCAKVLEKLNSRHVCRQSGAIEAFQRLFWEIRVCHN